MLTETLSGKCPCCGYDKLLQRYGSIGYHQLDGCANCGFGYSSNHHDDDDFGVGAWLPYAKHILASQFIESETNEFYERSLVELNKKSDEEVRRLVFDWCEQQTRCDDVESTVFVYGDDDIQKHIALNLPIFKTMVVKDKQEQINEVIALLKEIDIDGETMEDILAEVGLREQVLHQILDSEKYVSAKQTWDDIYNNEALIYNTFDDYYTDKHINEKM